MKVLFTLTFILSLVSTQTMASLCSVNCVLEKQFENMSASAENHGCCHENNSEKDNNHAEHLCSSDLSGICSHQQFALNGNDQLSHFFNIIFDSNFSYITLIKSLNLNDKEDMFHYLDSYHPKNSQPFYLLKSQFLI